MNINTLTMEPERVVQAWAKSEENRPSLSLVDHSIDVAAVVEALLLLPTIASRLGALAGRRLSATDVARLSFFTGLHDAGKANHGFQARLKGEKPDKGHIGPFWSIVSGDGLGKKQRMLRKDVRCALRASRWRDWFAGRDARVAMWNTVLAHHGSLPADRMAAAEPSFWRPRGEYNPLDALTEVAESLSGMFPPAFSTGPQPCLPDSPRFHHAFSGLITLADWLGSDATVFQCYGTGAPSGKVRIPWARKKATELLQRRWLDPQLARMAAQKRSADFATLFPKHSAPRPCQAAVLNADLPKPGHLVILEAETGSGKTEAALIHFLRLFQAGEVDGMYFALPTRAAAVQIHSRIRDTLQRWLGEAAPPVGLAVPGYLRVDDEEGSRLPDSHKILWPDGPVRDRAWAVENAKRYLSGLMMVGTVDQIMLGGLRVRHASLRSGLMLRLLLCVDEVHASDTYMTTLLCSVLEQHTQSGGHALLMSATLGSFARKRFLKKRVEPRSIPGFDEAAALPYPSIKRTGEALQPLVSDGRAKHVNVELVDPLCDRQLLWDRLKAAADAGAAVLFIRNSVADAQETVKELEARKVRLLRCKDRVAPHHGRFAPEDRRMLDAALLEAFPKGQRRGVVAVTTQTAEQSLDICSDWLVTDIAPGDVLLQRIGRLHRHNRARPKGFETATITVLAPTAQQLAQTLRRHCGTPRGKTLLGLGRVYENIIGVLAVRDWLESNGAIVIPTDNRAIVETSTHPSALYEYAQQLGDIWPVHLQSVMGSSLAKDQVAATVRIRWEECLLDNQPVDLEQEVVTRLGLKDRRIDLARPIEGPFGQKIRVLNIPGWMTDNAEEDDEVEELSNLNGTFRFRLGSREFQYDRFGLTSSSK